MLIDILHHIDYLADGIEGLARGNDKTLSMLASEYLKFLEKSESGFGDKFSAAMQRGFAAHHYGELKEALRELSPS